MTLTNSSRTMFNGTNSNSSSSSGSAFAITNVPPNEKLKFSSQWWYKYDEQYTIYTRSLTHDRYKSSNKFWYEVKWKQNYYHRKSSYPPVEFSALVKKEEGASSQWWSILIYHHATVVLIKTDPMLNNQEDVKPKMPQIDSTSKQLPKRPYSIYFTDELTSTFGTWWLRRWLLCEDSHPFRQPVDPVALNILDYPDNYQTTNGYFNYAE